MVEKTLTICSLHFHLVRNNLAQFEEDVSIAEVHQYHFYLGVVLHEIEDLFIANILHVFQMVADILDQ